MVTHEHEGLRDGALPVPDTELRWRVTGVADSTELAFRQGGLATLRDHERALRYLDTTPAEFERILDFGCGPGRVLRHMADVAEHAELHGCDIDRDAIAWASANLPFVRLVANEWLPPLPYEDGFFDLVVNHSVFTHLPEDYQDAWLAELRRVVRPGGVLVLSVAGPYAFEQLVQAYRDWPADPTPIERTIRENGFLYVADDSWSGTCFPDFYHSAFHTPDYVLERWGRLFTVLAYFPRAALEYQDVVLLRREPDA